MEALLIWDDGMSVGVESLDNDHKQLIKILSQLMSAKNENREWHIVEGIFQKLEHYCLSHFAREEALLAKINYQQLAEHKVSHQRFINKIPQLKKQWYADCSEPEVVKEKIVIFLQQWLLKHILEEDLDYVPAINCFQEFRRYKTEKKAKNPWLRFFSVKLSEQLTLRKRVIITTLLPSIAVFALCFFILQDNYLRYHNINKVLALNSMIEQVNGITHSLQAERGLSSGYTSSNYQNFSNQLSNRQESTDAKIHYFLWLLDQPVNRELKQSLQAYIVKVQSTVDNLARHRMHLDQKLISFDDTYFAYTKLIEQLLSVSDHLVHIEIGPNYINDISAINAILRYKEYMGQIRAMGMKMVESNHQDIYSNKDIGILIGMQLNTLRNFKNSSNETQTSLCAIYCEGALQRQKLELTYSEVMQHTNKEVRAQRWFKVMSAKIDIINTVVEGLVVEFNDKINKESQKLKIEGYLIIFFLSLFLLVIIFFALVLNYSIISPVRKLTYALNEMSAGQHNIHFNHSSSKDEIGSMQLAYEKLRRKLLQGDIYKATVSQQQEEIQYRKSQQDHFQHLALTDALTGAVNRHYFNEVLEQEIGNVNAHGKPLSIMVLDIDNFKSINDNYGHSVGDEVLIRFYQACDDAVRSSDVVARIGGEEFVIVMPNTKLNNAGKFAERLRENIAALEIIIAEQHISITVSIGVSQWHGDYFTSAESFVEHADKSLYQAKKTGRNKVVVTPVVQESHSLSSLSVDN